MSNAAIPAVVVGTGFGCRIHAPALKATGFDVAGLVGTDPERTARRAEREALPAPTPISTKRLPRLARKW